MVNPFPTFPSQGRVRHSDINIDGFDDLLMTLDIDVDGRNIKKSILLISQECTEHLCPEKAVSRKVGDHKNPRRYFNGV